MAEQLLEGLRGVDIPGSVKAEKPGEVSGSSYLYHVMFAALLILVIWYPLSFRYRSISDRAELLFFIRLLVVAAAWIVTYYRAQRIRSITLTALAVFLSASGMCQFGMMILTPPLREGLWPGNLMILQSASVFAGVAAASFFFLATKKANFASYTMWSSCAAVLGMVTAAVTAKRFIFLLPMPDRHHLALMMAVTLLSVLWLIHIGLRTRGPDLKSDLSKAALVFVAVYAITIPFAWILYVSIGGGSLNSWSLFGSVWLAADVCALAFFLKPSLLYSEASETHALESVVEAATRDPLTGLFNRRTLDEVGPDLFTGSHRLEQPVSLLMLDIDHFKRINDLHGHPAGDAVLQGFSQILQQQIRATDLLARYGGEEFVIVLPGAPLAPALRLAEKIRSRVETAPLSAGDGKTLHITASIGVATAFPGELSDLWALLEIADKNLYRAKSGGRNQVMASPLSADHTD